MFEYLPSIASLPGFILFSIFAYLLSLGLSTCTAYFVSKNVDVEGAIKKQLLKERNRNQ